MSDLEPHSPTPADDNHLLAERRAKLAEWRSSGQAYPNDFRRENTAGRPITTRFTSCPVTRSAFALR